MIFANLNFFALKINLPCNPICDKIAGKSSVEECVFSQTGMQGYSVIFLKINSCRLLFHRPFHSPNNVSAVIAGDLFLLQLPREGKCKQGSLLVVL